MKDSIPSIIRDIRLLFGTEDFIPLHAPIFIGNEREYVSECLDTTFVSSVGKFVDLFEERIQEYTGAKKAVVCVNGTNALHICLELLDVKQNDEVITQSLTFIATANAISYSKAIPLFIDVDIDTMSLSPEAMLDYLEENAEIKSDGFTYNKLTGRRIKACMPMHTFGHSGRIEQIAKICKNYNISLIEDAAEAMGSKSNGKHLGLFGEVSAISFNGNKIMTTGGGGVIITNNEELGKRAKHLTTQAKIAHQWEYVHDEIGYNYRMPNINAALGVAQLEMLPVFLESKRRLASEYSRLFKKYGISFFEEREGTYSNYWLNAIILSNNEERELFLKETNEKGVMTRPLWKLMHTLEMFKQNPRGNLKNSEWLEERVINIPSSVIWKKKGLN